MEHLHRLQLSSVEKGLCELAGLFQRVPEGILNERHKSSMANCVAGGKQDFR